jgi:MFS superfamily sulfate permease-like transporter
MTIVTARDRAMRLPGVAVLAGYRREWLRGDLLAGVAVAAYLVPQVMAYSGIAGLPPQAGLWACLGSLAIYAVLGSSRQLSVGPESTTALITATAVAPLALGDPVRYAALAAGLALVVGAICLLGGLVRAGSLADLLSQPVLVGYMAGIAVIMIVSQLGTVTGVPVEGGSPVAEVASFLSGLGAAHLPTVALALPLLAGILIGNRLRPTWPIPMIGMIAATAAVAAFSLDKLGVRLVGSAVSGLPVPGLPALSPHDVVSLVLPAVGVAIVAYSDNVLTARAFGARRGETHLARPHDGVLGYVPGVAGMHDVDDYPDARPVPGLLVYRYDAPLCFANAENFRRRALAAIDAEPEPPRWFLLNAEANVEIDSTAAQTLESLHAELRRRGIVLALARVKQDLRLNLQAAGLLDLIGEDRIFMTLPTAVEAFRAQGRSSPG